MEDFVTFEIAKKIKEKGFTLLTTEIYGKFDSDGVFHSQLYCNYYETMDLDEIIAPTISQVLKWLRNEKQLYIEIIYIPRIKEYNDYYLVTIQPIGGFTSAIHIPGNFNSFEEAALAGIKYLLEII